MQAVNIHIVMENNAEEAANYYAKVFETEVKELKRYEEISGFNNYKEIAHKVLIAKVPILRELELSLSDTLKNVHRDFRQGNNIQIGLQLTSEDEADYYYHMLNYQNNQIIRMHMTPWGEYLGIAADKFGLEWLISAECKSKKAVSSENAIAVDMMNNLMTLPNVAPV